MIKLVLSWSDEWLKIKVGSKLGEPMLEGEEEHEQTHHAFFPIF